MIANKNRLILKPDDGTLSTRFEGLTRLELPSQLVDRYQLSDLFILHLLHLNIIIELFRHLFRAFIACNPRRQHPAELRC